MANRTQNGAMQPAHLVHLYRSDPELVATIAAFLQPALREEQVAVLVATPQHRTGTLRLLSESGIDVAAATRAGRLVVLDARTTLDRLLVAGGPDARAFDEVIGGVARAAASDGHRVTFYGEMVALLWQAGQVNAAMDLEKLWNELAAHVPFRLLCSYQEAAVVGPQDAEALASMCDLHSSSVAPDLSELDTDRRASRSFDATPHAPAAARTYAVDVLRSWGRDDVIDDVRLIVSELTSNAVRHAGSSLVLGLEQARDTVRVSVRDDDRTEPVRRAPGAAEQGGRGLVLIDAVADAWGVEPVAGGGKVVWAELGPHPLEA